MTNSVVEGNVVHDNIGGILLTDETGPSHDNLIVRNISQNNLKFGGDCGITLPSHSACTEASTDATGCTLAAQINGIYQGYGVYHNAVVGNVLRRNGAAGTGVFTNPGAPPGAATKAYGNLISNNLIEDNGEAGVAIHVHAANGNADHNVIIGNVLRGNGSDPDAAPDVPHVGIVVLSDATLPGFEAAAPIVGTIITQNTIAHEDVDVWIGNTRTDAAVWLNDLHDDGAIGVQNAGTGTVVATDNWWGCPQGPGAAGCATVSGPGVVFTPWLTRPLGLLPGP